MQRYRTSIDSFHDQLVNSFHTHSLTSPEERRKARNKRKAAQRQQLQTKGPLKQERHLRPRTMRRAAARTVKRAEVLERKIQRWNKNLSFSL